MPNYENQRRGVLKRLSGQRDTLEVVAGKRGNPSRNYRNRRRILSCIVILMSLLWRRACSRMRIEIKLMRRECNDGLAAHDILFI